MKSLLFIFFLALTKAYSQEGGKVDEQFLKAVVYIQKDSFAGTGFIIGIDSGRKAQFFLVTNKHMIGFWSMVDSFKPSKEITITLYREDKKAPFTDIKIPIADAKDELNKNVIIHPNPFVDIACIHLNDYLIGNGIFNFTTLDTSFLTPLDSIKKTTFIGLGSQVFAIGYPANIMITKSNEPIVKSGYISSSFSGDLNMKEHWANKSKKDVVTINQGKYFLVDGFIIPGNSGGPVLSPILTTYYSNGHLYFREPPIQNRIIGIVSYSRPNTGITTVYAADYILDLIRAEILNGKK